MRRKAAGASLCVIDGPGAASDCHYGFLLQYPIILAGHRHVKDV